MVFGFELDDHRGGQFGSVGKGCDFCFHSTPFVGMGLTYELNYKDATFICTIDELFANHRCIAYHWVWTTEKNTKLKA